MNEMTFNMESFARSVCMGPKKEMEMEAKHEPTPWILGGCSGRMITTPNGYMGDGFIADVDTKANAEFIVRACNSHDKARCLLERLLTSTNDGELIHDIKKVLLEM